MVYFDLYFELENDELDEFLEEVRDEIEAKKDEIISDECVEIDCTVEIDNNEYRNFDFKKYGDDLAEGENFDLFVDELIDEINEKIEARLPVIF